MTVPIVTTEPFHSSARIVAVGDEARGATELDDLMTPYIYPDITEPSGQYLPEVNCLNTVARLLDIRVFTWWAKKTARQGSPQGGRLNSDAFYLGVG